MIKTALVGFGRSARVFHLPFLKFIAEYEISAFVSSKLESIKQEYPGARVYATVAELAQDAEIDLAIISSPTFLHYEQAKLLLEAGKHVIVEKPFTVRATEAAELVQLAERNKLKLSVYHNRRWDNGFLTLKRLIQEGALGDIYHYEVHYDRWRPEVQDRWREQDIAGAGIFYDFGSHVVDQVLELFGAPDEIITDIQAQRLGARAIDYFHLIFKYNSMRAILHCSSLVQAPQNHLVVHGSKASFIHSTLDPQEEALMQGRSPTEADWGLATAANVTKLICLQDGAMQEKIIEPELGSYQSFYQLMARSILHNEPVPVEPSSVIETIKIIERVNNSGNKVVR